MPAMNASHVIPNCHPGDYQFQVEAFNEDGVESQTAASFNVVVLPQFWQTTWFALLVIVVTLGIVAAIVRYITTKKHHRQLKRQKQQ